jgi:uncharacterized protein (TIGR03000 family)
MQVNNHASGTLIVLTVVAMLSTHAAVEAQVLSKWGHPVITLGWSPYDWDETGLGHYDGWPWRFPSYADYRGNASEMRYPWTDGRGTPRGRLGIAPSLFAPLAEEIPPPDAALVIVKLPAEAELWFDDTRTTQDGSYRRFVTPPLEAGQPVVCTLRVRWHVKDADLTRVEKVEAEAGKCVTVNFLTVDSWTGVRTETLKMPRKVSSVVPRLEGPTVH